MARKPPTPFLSAARKGGKNTIRLEGTEDIGFALRQLEMDVQGEYLRVAVAEGAEIVRDVASQLAPRSSGGSHGHEPGFLAANIVAERQWTGRKDSALSHIGMSEKAWYGRFQEIGTTFQPAQPFLRPALDETKQSVIDAVAASLRKQILSSLR